MTLPNDSIQVNVGTGPPMAVQTPTGQTKEFQVLMLADALGHIYGTQDTYVAFALPVSTVGASKVHFDFWNATGSGKKANIHGLYFFNDLTFALAGVVAVRMDLHRSTAIGTGGTAFTNEATVAGRTISKLDPAMAALPAGVTMREAPTGGATAGAYLGSLYSMPEESATSMGYITQMQNMVPGGGYGPHLPNLVVPENSGLRMVQGPVASVGTIGVMMLFTLV